MENLDIKCAKLGQELGGMMEEKTLNAALAVLEEQGPYAMFLYLKGREKEVAGEVNRKCATFLQDINFPSLKNQKGEGNCLQIVEQLSTNLDELLFARDLLRQALAYARYHLKAKGS